MVNFENPLEVEQYLKASDYKTVLTGKISLYDINEPYIKGFVLVMAVVLVMMAIFLIVIPILKGSATEFIIRSLKLYFLPFFLIGIFGLIFLNFYPFGPVKQMYQLLNNGNSAVGMVASVKKVGEPEFTVINFFYLDADGIVRRSENKLNTDCEFAVGEVGTVLYLQAPDSFAWFIGSDWKMHYLQ